MVCGRQKDKKRHKGDAEVEEGAKGKDDQRPGDSCEERVREIRDRVKGDEEGEIDERDGKYEALEMDCIFGNGEGEIDEC
jgi:hypothetical protein